MSVAEAEPVEKDTAFEDAEKVAQIFSGVFFTGLALWLIFANGTKLSFIQRASLEKRLTVCCFINTYVGVFSAFFNFFQLTEVDNFLLPQRDGFVLDFARPLEWIVTCPLMQLVLVLMGGSRIPEYRRVMMPTLSALVLFMGVASMLTTGLLRLILYAVGFSIALVMWFHNYKQIKEHSNGEETLLQGDSEFRKASVLLIATWFPFPLWYIISPEGLGLLNNVLIIQVGWAFLNIVSKFTFIFYIQRIKDNYCNRLKVKRELYGAAHSVGGMLDDGANPKTAQGHQVAPALGAEREASRQEKGELGAVVIETMSFLGMSQHTDRFSRLLHQAEITSTDQVMKLTQPRAEELQLPWDLICALQRRIQVWQLEMRDTAELELEKGEKHYRHAHDIQMFPPLKADIEPAPPTVDLSGVEKRMDRIEEQIGQHEDRLADRVIGRMQGLFQGVLEKAEVYHSAQLRQLYEVEGNIRRSMQETDGQVAQRLEQYRTEAAQRLEQHRADIGSRFDQQMGVLASHERRFEDLLSDTAERSQRGMEAHTRELETLSRDLQAKTEGCSAAQLQQQADLSSDLVRKLDDALAKAVSSITGETHNEITKLAGEVGNVCGQTVQKWSQEVQKATTEVQSAAQGVQNVGSDVQNTGWEVRKLVERTSGESQRACVEIAEQAAEVDRTLKQAAENMDSSFQQLAESMDRSFKQAIESLYDKQARIHMEMEGSTTRKLDDLGMKLSERTDRGVEGLRAVFANDISALVTRNDALVTRSDALAEAIRDSREVNKEGVADLRRLSMMIMDQANAGHERIHLSAGKVAELHRAVEMGMDRLLRGLGDLGAGLSVTAGALNQGSLAPSALTHTATPPVGCFPRWTSTAEKPTPMRPTSPTGDVRDVIDSQQNQGGACSMGQQSPRHQAYQTQQAHQAQGDQVSSPPMTPTMPPTMTQQAMTPPQSAGRRIGSAGNRYGMQVING